MNNEAYVNQIKRITMPRLSIAYSKSNIIKLLKQRSRCHFYSHNQSVLRSPPVHLSAFSPSELPQHRDSAYVSRLFLFSPLRDTYKTTRRILLKQRRLISIQTTRTYRPCTPFDRDNRPYDDLRLRTKRHNGDERRSLHDSGRRRHPK